MFLSIRDQMEKFLGFLRDLIEYFHDAFKIRQVERFSILWTSLDWLSIQKQKQHSFTFFR